MNMLFLTGIICAITGLWLGYIVGRRRFYRRNVVGIERFRSYNRMILIRALAKLLISGLLKASFIPPKESEIFSPKNESQTDA